MTGAGFSSAAFSALLTTWEDTVGAEEAEAGSGELLEVASVNELVDDCLLDEADVDEVLAEVGLFCWLPVW